MPLAPIAARASEFSDDGRTRRVAVPPTPRQFCFAAGLDSLLEAIARPRAEPPACGVQLGIEVVRILSEAEQSLAKPRLVKLGDKATCATQWRRSTWSAAALWPTWKQSIRTARI